ncbi:unnamed protein product [Triticum aestivum]|uniref:Pterin-binding domain-containing protein n=3 Tax=Triticinae TaxID=1648030 RepID=A0A7H4LIX8_WHEAT|nr:unnamed protein product [Triticum aestivum]
MAILMSCVTSKTLAPCTPEVSRQQRHTCISVSAHRRQIRIGLTMKSWGTSCTVPPMWIRGATRFRLFTSASHSARLLSFSLAPLLTYKRITAVGSGPGELPEEKSPIPNKEAAISSDPGELPGKSPLPNKSSLVTVVVGGVFGAVSFYGQMRAMEENVEKTAEVAIETIEKAADVVDKLADEVIAFPGNENLKKAAFRIKAIAEEIEKDAEEAEALIHKVEEIEKEVDAAVDTFMGKGMKKGSR